METFGIRHRGTKRLIERGGNFNQCKGSLSLRRKIKRKWWRALYGMDWFHTLIDMPTFRIIAILMITYMGIILIFSFFYYWISVLFGCNLQLDRFVEAFAFSLETMATVGYGTFDIFFDDCIIPILVLSIQVCVKLIVDAVTIGVLYCKLSRPNARASTVLFSNKAIIRRIRGKLYLMFQLCELRKHQLVEAHVRLYAVRNEVDPSMLDTQDIPTGVPSDGVNRTNVNEENVIKSGVEVAEQIAGQKTDCASDEHDTVALGIGRIKSFSRFKAYGSFLNLASANQKSPSGTTKTRRSSHADIDDCSDSEGIALQESTALLGRDIEEGNLSLAQSPSSQHNYGAASSDYNCQQENRKASFTNASSEMNIMDDDDLDDDGDFYTQDQYMRLPKQANGDPPPLSMFGKCSFMQTCAMRLNHPNDELGSMLLLMTPQVVVHEIDAGSPLMPPPLWYCNYALNGQHYVRWNPPVFRHFAQCPQPSIPVQNTCVAPMADTKTNTSPSIILHPPLATDTCKTGSGHAPKKKSFGGSGHASMRKSNLNRVSSVRLNHHKLNHRYNQHVRLHHQHPAAPSFLHNNTHLDFNNQDNHHQQHQQSVNLVAPSAPFVVYDAEALARIEFPSVSRRIEDSSTPAPVESKQSTVSNVSDISEFAAQKYQHTTASVSSLKVPSTSFDTETSPAPKSRQLERSRVSFAPANLYEDNNRQHSKPSFIEAESDSTAGIADLNISKNNRLRNSNDKTKSMSRSSDSIDSNESAVEVKLPSIGNNSWSLFSDDSEPTSSNDSNDVDEFNESSFSLDIDTDGHNSYNDGDKVDSRRPPQVLVRTSSTFLRGVGGSQGGTLPTAGLSHFADFMNDPIALAAAATPPHTPLPGTSHRKSFTYESVDANETKEPPRSGIRRHSSGSSEKLLNIVNNQQGSHVADFRPTFQSSKSFQSKSTNSSLVARAIENNIRLSNTHNEDFRDVDEMNNRQHEFSRNISQANQNQQSFQPQQQPSQNLTQQQFYDRHGEFDWQFEERKMVQRYMRDRQIELIVVVEGVDAATGGIVQARHSYTCDEIDWDKSFKFCVQKDAEDGCTTIDFSLFHELCDVPKDSSYAGPIASVL